MNESVCKSQTTPSALSSTLESKSIFRTFSDTMLGSSLLITSGDDETNLPSSTRPSFNIAQRRSIKSTASEGDDTE